MGKEIAFVPERVPLTDNVKHLGLQGYVWSDGLVFATDRNGHSLYVIVPYTWPHQGPSWIMLLDRRYSRISRTRTSLFSVPVRVRRPGRQHVENGRFGSVSP